MNMKKNKKNENEYLFLLFHTNFDNECFSSIVPQNSRNDK